MQHATKARECASAIARTLVAKAFGCRERVVLCDKHTVVDWANVRRAAENASVRRAPDSHDIQKRPPRARSEKLAKGPEAPPPCTRTPKRSAGSARRRARNPAAVGGSAGRDTRSLVFRTHDHSANRQARRLSDTRTPSNNTSFFFCPTSSSTLLNVRRAPRGLCRLFVTRNVGKSVATCVTRPWGGGGGGRAPEKREVARGRHFHSFCFGPVDFFFRFNKPTSQILNLPDAPIVATRVSKSEKQKPLGQAPKKSLCAQTSRPQKRRTRRAHKHKTQMSEHGAQTRAQERTLSRF